MERGKDILEKQTFQCVKKIKFIPGQHYFKTDDLPLRQKRVIRHT